ncbi:MAG TPA: hypothetical protein VHA34_07070, partial [Actinomycetes bacterium]|nr:hypothetical protein [Actinomycetes bacterium]
QGRAVAELERFGASTDQLLAALRARAVDVPTVPVAEPDRRPWGETVYFPVDRLDDVLARLDQDLKPGDWGWNHHDGRAWADAVATVDLRAIVEDVLSVGGGGGA